jgi:hypothetical protein
LIHSRLQSRHRIARFFPAWGAILAALQAPLFEYNGARKISTNVLWQPKHLPWVTPNMLADMGYARPETKLKALTRMYFNPVEADRVRALLLKRRGQAFSAVSMSMVAGAKDSRSMGHCLSAIIISFTPKRCEATITYRSTELIKKFSADLAFLPRVFEQLGISPTRVSFFFGNCFVSGVFFPTLFNYIDPIDFLEMLRKTDPMMLKVATRFLRRSVRNRNQKFPFAPEQHQHDYAWRHFPEKMKVIRDYLRTQDLG